VIDDNLVVVEKKVIVDEVQFYESSDVAENSVVGISSLKLVDKSLVLVKNAGLKWEELDVKAVISRSLLKSLI
jgi:hypothetical protein